MTKNKLTAIIAGAVGACMLGSFTVLKKENR